MATVVECWNLLDSTRSIGMAVGPIPITAVWTWCERKQLDDDLTTAIASAINYLDAQRAKRSAQTKPKPNPRSR